MRDGEEIKKWPNPQLSKYLCSYVMYTFVEYNFGPAFEHVAISIIFVLGHIKNTQSISYLLPILLALNI